MDTNASAATDSSANNSTYAFRDGSIIALSSLNVIGLLENFFIIYIICKTSAFKGISRVLVLNTTMADIGVDAVSLVFLLQTSFEALRFPTPLYKLLLLSLCLVCVFQSSHSMMGTAISVYFAICHQIGYANFHIRKVVAIVFGMLIVNSGMALLHFLTDGYYTIHPVTSAIKVTYNRSTWWVGGLIILNVSLIPLLVTTFCFCRVRYYCKLLATTYSSTAGFQKTLNMLALARMNMVCFTVFMGSWTSISISQAIDLPKGITAAVSVLVFSYRISKIFLYLGFYPPFRRRIQRLFCCGNSVSTDLSRTSSN